MANRTGRIAVVLIDGNTVGFAHDYDDTDQDELSYYYAAVRGLGQDAVEGNTIEGFDEHNDFVVIPARTVAYVRGIK